MLFFFLRMKKSAKLYLFPVPLGDENPRSSVPTNNVSVLNEVEYIVAENSKTARKWMKLLGCEKPLQDFEYAELNEHTRDNELIEIAQPLLDGKITAYLSEAGCPAIADPGAILVEFCHSKNIPVIPLIGPSSILLALMGSGMNGQQFCFHGYLPREKSARIKSLRELESTAAKKKQTQIFIETPYRNNHLIEDILQNLHRETRLCIASNLSQPNQKIKTKSVEEWKKQVPNMDKIPAVFLLGK